MTNVLRFSVIALLLGALLVPAFAQQEMTKEDWQKQITELTVKVTDLKAKFDNAKKDLADLQKQADDKAAALKKCQEDLTALMGEQEKVLQSDVDKIEGRLSELARLSNQDLYARRAEIDELQKWIDEAKKNPASGVGTNAVKLDDQQSRLDGMKKSLEQYVASGQAMQTYTVGSWAKDRDCLWNIAKKPKIYDNPFLWPKIWQGNRDQIKNPDVIQPGQKLKIPPKADLSKEEKSALRKYWSKKEAVAAPAK
jgi:nucleoid-associated protein YgaU